MGCLLVIIPSAKRVHTSPPSHIPFSPRHGPLVRRCISPGGSSCMCSAPLLLHTRPALRRMGRIGGGSFATPAVTTPLLLLAPPHSQSLLPRSAATCAPSL